ncbi:MAG: tetratricopeptide repeat protein [Candidatus Marinimicrobia bacterium]|nr:tetratricopeptide repeat protein [Candidatus Neomarinimicrobiota bacterium]MCF7828640.1 tetratricopeptide repeat protein [Candidatus Neomarinimicrobiota bacterium]MCF7880381.1 tetratricopeptide repeat protein [Candidatus Neomarinimicrobiota bacterium]
MFKTKIFIVGLLCAALLPATILAQNTQEQRAYLYANELYEDGLYEIALEQYRQYLNDYPRGSHRAAAALRIGKSLMEIQQYDESRRAFQEVDLDHPGTPEAQEALWLIAETFEKEQRWERAAKAFQRLYLYYPDGDRASESLLRGAADAQRASNDNLTESLLNAVVENFYDSPAAIDARIRLGQLYLEQRKSRLAWNELDKALYSSPSEEQRGRILMWRAKVAERLYGASRASEIYGRITNEFSRDSLAERATLEQGRLAFLQRNYSVAEDHFSDAEESDLPSVAVAGFEYHGDMEWARENYSRAAELYSQSLTKQGNTGDNRTIRIKYALALEQAGQTGDAYEQFTQILRENAQTLSDDRVNLIHDHLAAVAVEQEQYRAALRSLEALRHGDKRAEILHRIGDLYQRQLSDSQSAMEVYTLLTDSFPDYTGVDKVLFSLGKSYLETEQVAKATNAFNRLVQQYPYSFWRGDAENYLWYIEKANSPGKQTSYESLASLFGELLLDREPADLNFKLGMIYFRDQRNYQTAIQQFTSLLKEDLSSSREDSVRFYLARSYDILSRVATLEEQAEESGEYATNAIAEYEALLSDEAGSGGIYFTAQKRLGELYLKTDPQRAIAYFDDLATENNSEAIILSQAKAYQATGNDSAAFRILNNYLESSLGSEESPETIRLAASLAEEIGYRGPARKYYEWYSANYSTSHYGAEAWWALFRYSVADSQYAEALRYADRIRSTAFYTPYQQMVNEQIGTLYMRTGEYLKAAEWYASLANSDGPETSLFIGDRPTENVEAIYRSALAYEEAGQQSKAIEMYRWYTEHGEKAEFLANAYEFIAQQTSRENSYNEARQYYQQAAASLGNSASPRAIRLRKSAADMLFELGDYESAAEEYNQLLDEAVGDFRSEIWQQLIIAQLRNGSTRRANSLIDEYRETYDLDDDAEPVLRFRYETAKALANEKGFQQSVPMLQDILEHDISTDFEVNVRYELGRQYVITNNYDQAINMLTDLTVNYPDHPVIAQVYITLGTVYYDQEQPANAIEAYRNALDHGATGEFKQVAMSNLMKLYEERGLWDSAIALGRDYVAEFPEADNTFSTRIQIGNFLMNMREFERAIEHLSALLREADAQSASEIQFWIGEAYFNQAKYTRAIIEYLKVPYLNPPTKLDWAASALWKAGNAYEKLQKPNKAIQLYERIIREKGAASNFGRFARRRIDELEAQQEAAQ